MTKIPVNIPGFVPSIPTGTGKAAGAEKGEDFGKILENTKNAGTDVKTMENKTQEEASEIPDEKVERTEKTDENQVTDVKETKEVTKTEPAEQKKDADTGQEEFTQEEISLLLPMLQVATADVKALLAEALGISQEELSGMLEELGVSEADLLDADALKQLFLQLKGAEDMTALLTDEQLYADLQSLENGFAEIMENVQETAGLSEEDMQALKEQLGQLNVSETDVSGKGGMPIVNAQDNQQETSKDGKEKEADSQPVILLQQTHTVNGNNSLEQSVSMLPRTGAFTNSETENIMNQILDYMKIQLNAENSELEMQLQPESLGTLQIRISAKEGVMTAQFTTASESVRAALESQMVVLQQQLESQNVKVEAIEVMVQTHQFESALEQGNERHTEEDNKRNRTRKIDLNSLEEGREMDDDDRIVAEMMAANGNTVDYLA